MATDRLLGHFEEFDPQRIEEVFGREFILKPPDPSVTLAPIKRVALLTEAFLPKVDGVSKSAFLTLSYLKQTGREVLVFAPDIAPRRIGNTEIVPLPSVGFPRIPETRLALPIPIIARKMQQFAQHRWDVEPLLARALSPATEMLKDNVNPGHLADTVGTVRHATLEEVEGAIEDAVSFAPDWDRVPGRERAAMLENAAEPSPSTSLLISCKSRTRTA